MIEAAEPLPQATAPESLPLPLGEGQGEGVPSPWRHVQRAWPWALGGVLVLLTLLALPRLADAATTAALRAAGWELVALDPPSGHIDAVAVHGGGPPSAVRERPAAALLASGQADVVVAMGGPLPPGDPDLSYAGAVVRRLDEIGVDPARVIRMDEGLSTEGELRALRRLAESRGWHSIALSSSPWHTRRVGFLAHQVFGGSGIAISVIADPTGDINLDQWWQRPYGRRMILGEWLKLALAFVQS